MGRKTQVSIVGRSSGMSKMRPFATIHVELKENEKLNRKAGNEVIKEVVK